MKHSFFHDKNILITGASRGLGRELALHCASQGARVFAIARDEEKLRLLAATSSHIHPYVADITQAAWSDQLRRILHEYPIDIAILNAGIKERSEHLFSLPSVERTFAVNVFGACRTVEVLLPQMREQQHGHLVFISSMGAHHGMVQASGYNASKAALLNLATSLRMDLVREKIPITVTVVEPGLFRTSMISSKGLMNWLAMDVSAVSKRIIKGIVRGEEKIVCPKWMSFMTQVIAHVPGRWQRMLLTRVKS
ncbi:MAG: hypothetical protein A3I05_05045 [Deltaproteobacteria bacterium RIFCSPLOWO2_02_FULL_44_10]|nr:MAG: hypothetical protein A3C46_05805 [Deltaproteobacteria bacterium RIFCSPHIGHO2_02_FULL_44_16]OGQ45961.1 MAG: hypothetical protein A3I05_05045 [Deltaproteobacteria bacterium RIFCSPLOWO2_02_FULL_44_10]